LATPASRLRRPLVLDRLPNRGGRRPHYGLTFATLVMAVLAYALMQSLVAPALLSIQHDVHTSTTTVTWLLSGYLLSACVATPILSRFGDMFGKRRMVICVLLAFLVGTVVCALATSITQLILGRVIQGAGGALFPLSVGIIRDEFPSRRVVTGVATLSGIIGTGSSIGIVLAGPITDYLSYHWLFWIPLVPIAAATAACFVVVPESPKRDRVPVDWLGGVLLAAWLVAILLAVSESTKWGWGSGRIVGLFAGGAVLAVVWGAVEARTVHPLVDLQIMRLRAVWTSNAAAFLIGFGLFTGFVLIPQFAEAPASTGYGFGASVTGGSLLLVPMSLAMLVVSMVVGKTLPRTGTRLPITVGALLTGSALAALALAHGHPWEVYLESSLIGLGIGSAYASLANQVVDWVPSTHTSVAIGMNAIVRFAGGAFGAQVSAAVLAGSSGASGRPTEHGFVVAFGIAAAVAMSAAFVAFAAPGRGRRPRDAATVQQSSPNSA
jgi:MFS family permease